MTRIAYIVHDLNDSAVARRVAMLRLAGATIDLAGFHRGTGAPASVAGVAPVSLGQTADARLGQRLKAVAAHIARPGLVKRVTAQADVIMARNLESLAMAARARSGKSQRLVYECLDIHRTLTGTTLPDRAIQQVESRLLGRTDLVIVSSPAFIEHHFARRLPISTPTRLVENKLFGVGAPHQPPPPPSGPPWTIGWFGMLRCERTLKTLAQLAVRAEGTIEILIAGKPSAAVFADFERQIANVPHCRYLGPYRPEDLPGLYGQCHFAWSIDWFEEGLNSSWLLPNRIYEASAFGVVPIALNSVETGRWLARHRAGALITPDDVEAQLLARFAQLGADQYAAMRDAMAAIPRSALIADADDCREMLAAIAGAAT